MYIMEEKLGGICNNNYKIFLEVRQGVPSDLLEKLEQLTLQTWIHTGLMEGGHSIRIHLDRFVVGNVMSCLYSLQSPGNG
jgi:hypothetical protein